MAVYEIVEVALGQLGKWFDRWRTENKDKAEQLESASTSVRGAIAESQIYLGRVLRAGERDLGTEADLARRWAEAARQTRRISPEVSERCFELSEFWADAPLNTVQQLERLKKNLGEVYRQAKLSSMILPA